MELGQKAAIKADTIYFYCCAGLGDTMLTCGFLPALKKKYGAPIHLIVKKTHAVVMQMYEITDYWVKGVDISAEEIEAHTSTNVEAGKIYHAHPCEHPEMWKFFEPVYYYTSTIRFMTWFRRFLQINPDEPLVYPTKYPQMSETFKEQCLRFAPVDKLVLFSPEATSVPGIPMYYWEEKAKELRKKGLVVLSNVIVPENTIAGTKYLKMSVEDALALAFKCHSIYSVRSGFCDLLFSRGPDLHVLYPLHNTFFLYSMNEMFPEYHIDEKIVIPE